MDNGVTLYWLADRADRRYSETVKSRTGKTRWTLTREQEQIPEVLAAYREKINADAAWLGFLCSARS